MDHTENPAARQKGECSRCHQLNAYTNFTCSYCGDRLAWADTFAETSGEKCPQCSKFNPYVNSDCKACGARLPWFNATAARRAARGNVDTGQKKMVLAIILGAVGFMLYLFYSVVNMAPGN